MERSSVVKEEEREERESEKGASGLRSISGLGDSRGVGFERRGGSNMSRFLYFAKSRSSWCCFPIPMFS